MNNKKGLTNPQKLASILLEGIKRYIAAKKAEKHIGWAVDLEKKRSVNTTVIDDLENRK